MNIDNLFVTRIEDLFATLTAIKSSDSEYAMRKELNMANILKFLSKENLMHKIKRSKKINISKTDDSYTVEAFNIVDYSQEIMFRGVLQIFLNLPLQVYSGNDLSEVMKTEIENVLENENFTEDELLINKGKKAVFNIYSNAVNDIQFERWCNVVSKKDLKRIVMTVHKDIKICRDKQEVMFHYAIKSRNCKLEIVVKDMGSGIYEVYTKMELGINKNILENMYERIAPTVSTEMKFIMNSHERFYEIQCHDTLNNGKSVSGRITNKMIYDRSKNRTEKHFTKSERDHNFNETSGEWYETEVNSDYSYGHKYYSNSYKRNFAEDWWKTQRENFLELKVNKDLDDGYGTKSHESFGYKEENGRRVYEFNDNTVDVIHKGEVITDKKGFDYNCTWNSKIIKIIPTAENGNQGEINHVENWGKNLHSNEEWFEKWYESHDQKYSFKWGRNADTEWEEEWKELMPNLDELEKYCYKKCDKFEDRYKWFETWNEKYFKNQNKVFKSCYKMNEDYANGIKNEQSWNNTNTI